MNDVQEQLRLGIRAALTRQGWTQQVFADKLGISIKHLNAVLTGKASATVDLWDRMFKECRHYITVTIQPMPNEWAPDISRE